LPRRQPAAIAEPAAPGPGAADKPLAILDAAASLLMELGFAATSVDDISETYRATKGLVCYHYRSKSALFFAVQRRAMKLTREAIEPFASSDASRADKI